MKRTLWIVAQIIWVAICVLALIEARQGYRGASDWQMGEGLAFEMMVLSFPSSFAVAIGLASTGAILGLFGLALPAPSRLEMTCTWFLFVVAGYIQWFVLVPIFLARRKRNPQLPVSEMAICNSCSATRLLSDKTEGWFIVANAQTQLTVARVNVKRECRYSDGTH